MIQNNRLWVLMSRRLSGEASPPEAEELQQLLEQSPDKHYLLEILHSYFTVLPDSITGPGLEDTDLEQRWRKIIDLGKQGYFELADEAQEKPDIGRSETGQTAEPEEYNGRLIRRPFRRTMGYAAAAVAVVLLGWGLFRARTGVPDNLKEVKGGEVLSRPGARTKLLLPDGTQVWLNSSSRLKYTHNFDGPSREVELEGEAYFDVVKDLQRPFIVHTSALDVRVLGTAFTVKSYPQDETIETTLLRGVIEVSRKDNPNTPRVILKANEKLVFNKHLSSPLPPAHLSDSMKARSFPAPPDIAVNSIPRNVPDSEKVETGWMYNRLVFNGDSFKELSEKMERWYNVKIFFKDQRLYNYRFGGSFTNETIQDALDALQLTADFTYKIKGNEIELYGK
jgi:ferric-dicitrate binding protein FerR (iron transport regulator)